MDNKEIHILKEIGSMEHLPSEYVDTRHSLDYGMNARSPEDKMWERFVTKTSHSEGHADGVLTNSAMGDDVCPTWEALVGECDNETVARRNAKFISHRLNLPYAQDLGDGSFRLGKYCGKDAYYCCARPDEGFFNCHKVDTLLITPNVSSVPRDWACVNGCRAVKTSEMFYGREDGSIGDSDVLADLKRGKKASTASLRNTRNKRTRLWGAMLVTLYYHDYEASDYDRDGLIKKAAAARWYRLANKDSKEEVSDKTLGRDLDYFIGCAHERGDGFRYDRLVGMLLVRAGKPNLSARQRSRAGERIKQALVELEDLDSRSALDMTPAEDEEIGFEADSEGRSRCIPATSGNPQYLSVW